MCCPTSSLWNCERINFCAANYPVYGTWWCQPCDTHTGLHCSSLVTWFCWTLTFTYFTSFHLHLCPLKFIIHFTLQIRKLNHTDANSTRLLPSLIGPEPWEHLTCLSQLWRQLWLWECGREVFSALFCIKINFWCPISVNDAFLFNASFHYCQCLYVKFSLLPPSEEIYSSLRHSEENLIMGFFQAPWQCHMNNAQAD